MKRALVAVFVSLLGLGFLQAAHFNCTLDSACTAASPCDWNTAGNWNDNGLCNGVAPANGGGHTYAVTIPAGRVVNLATDALTVGLATQANPAITINGTMTMSTATSGRDANGFRTLNLLPNNAGATSGTAIAIATTGTLRVPSGNRLHFDTSSGNRAQINTTGNAVLELVGNVVAAKLAAVGTLAANDTLCGLADGNLVYYELAVESGIEAAKVGRRIRFNDGELRTRQFEIVSVDADINDRCTGAGAPFSCCSGAAAGTCQSLGAGAIGICTALVDGTSLTCGAGATCGQRLTGHATIGQFPDSTPSANTRHWTPTPMGNDVCTAAKAPEPYCTADEAGTGFLIVPRAGDEIEIIDDVWLMQTAGTAGVQIVGTNLTSMPRIQAVNFGGGAFSVQGVAGTDASDAPMKWINLHDYVAGAFNIFGWKNLEIVKNTCHDASSTAVDSAACLAQNPYHETSSTTADGAVISDNHVYRARGNGVNLNSSAVDFAGTGCKVQRNLVEAGCTTGAGGECRGIEVNMCDGADVSWNLVYDIVDAGGGANQNGDCYRSSGTVSATETSGMVFHHNIGVNCGRHGIRLDSTANGSQQIAVTHNYVSNIWQNGINGGKLYNNFVRNVDLSKQTVTAINYPVLAYDNFVVMHDAVVETGYCSGACGSIGVRLGYDATYLNHSPALTISDLLVRAPSNSAGGCCVGGVFATGAHNGAMTIDHVTLDANGRTTQGAVNFFHLVWAPTSNTTATVRDIAATHGNNGQVGYCTNDAQALETYGTYAGNASSITAEQVGTSNPIGGSGDCTSAGTRFNVGNAGFGFTDQAGLNYQLVDGAPLATAGAFPSGSALGMRGWRFNWDQMAAPWGGRFPWTLSAGDPTGETQTTLPKDFSNGTCAGLTACNQDTDGDGVMDLHDNCDGTWNPSQLDTDEDNKGDACDR